VPVILATIFHGKPAMRGTPSASQHSPLSMYIHLSKLPNIHNSRVTLLATSTRFHCAAAVSAGRFSAGHVARLAGCADSVDADRVCWRWETSTRARSLAAIVVGAVVRGTAEVSNPPQQPPDCEPAQVMFPA
jgi:hypothetical protein